MFYKKKTAHTLERELFQNPTAEYRGAPFWSWNCKITKELIDQQIDIYHKMGIGGFTVHPRTGLETAYMSEEYLDLVKYCNERAKEKGMFCYLYDEDRYASGAAGGMVTENVRYRQRFMLLSRKQQEELCDTREEYEAQIDQGHKPKGYYITSYWVVLDDNGYLKEYKRIQKDETFEQGKVWHAYVKLAKESPWFNDQTYIDVFNKEAVERFIELTHQRYYETLGEDFGNSVPSIFTDEPQMAGKFAFGTPKDDRDATLSYTDDMDETFKVAFGTSLLDIVPEILWELPDDNKSVHRYHYHDHLSERFTQAFPDTIAKWCGERNLAMTGHFMSERTLYSQNLALGEAMRLYRNMQIPGIDILCDAKELTTAKQAVSVARQCGREGVLSELYGVTHWDADFKTYKLQGDWQAALGVTIRAHHLTFMSMEGEAKRDWPASIGYQSPWHTKFSYVEDHFARVNTALTRGVPEVKVAVIHPIESFWISYGPNSQTQTIRDQLDDNYEKLMQWLLYGAVDFDLISESMFPDFCKELPTTNHLQVGAMSYDTVLVPSCITLRGTTLDRLEAFAKAGGKIVFAGNAPKFVDAVFSFRATSLAERWCNCVQFNRAEILDALAEDRSVEIRDGKGRLSENLMYQMRKDGNEKWLFVCHVNRKNNILEKHEKYFIKVKGIWNPTLYDTITGEVVPYKASVQDGNTIIKVQIFAEDSLLFKLEQGEPKVLTEESVLKYTCKKISRPNAFSLTEPNVFLLDYAEYKFDDGEWQDRMDILTIDNEFRMELGLPRRQDHLTQPWKVPNIPPTNKVTLRYRFDSKVEVSGVNYAMERPENAVITMNGERVDAQVNGWYVDRFIRKVELPRLQKGENELLVEIPFGRKVNLEWSYLLGDFGVTVYGDYACITEKPNKLVFGDVVSQKLPFYTGNILYKLEEEFSRDYEDVILEVPHFSSPVLEIFMDGQSLGLIAYAPHKLSLGPVTAGRHEIDILMYGNRFNGFGTIHNANDEYKWYGPDSYRTNGSQWSDSYLLRKVGVLSAVNLYLGI